MAEGYSKEGSDLKERFRKLYEQWKSEFYDGAQIRKTEKNPTGKGITLGRAERGFRSALLSTDDVHLDYIDNRLSKGADMKSIMGGLGGRVQKLTQGTTSPYAVTSIDTMHHRNPHSAYEAAMRIQDPEVLLEFLEISADNGEFYGESIYNLLGTSLDSRSHVGNRGKGGTKFNPVVSGAGPEGSAQTSAHPRGDANDPFKLEAKKYSSGQEMWDAASFVRDQNTRDAAVGLASDQTRRDFLRGALAQEGIVEGNVFGGSADLKDIDKAKKFFDSRPDLLTGAAEAFRPASLDTVQGVAKLKIPKMPGWLKVGGLLTVAGVIGDASQAAEGISNLSSKSDTKLDKLKQSKAKADIATGVTGLASIFIPPLVVPSLINSAGSIRLQNRIEHEERRYRTPTAPVNRGQQISAPVGKNEAYRNPAAPNRLSVGFAEGGM